MSRPLTDVLKERGIPYRTGVLGATLCTFHIGGPVSLLIEPCCVGELIEATRACHAADVPFAVIGRGSNVLFDDGEIRTVLIRTVRVDGFRFANDSLVADCGVSLSRLSRKSAEWGLSGLEFACGIPGTLGGGVCMNAGAHGNAMENVVRSVEIFDVVENKKKTLFHHELNYSYRKSRFQDEKSVILRVELALSLAKEPEAPIREITRLLAHRNQTQPTDLPSAGSVFRRPLPNLPLSRLLDELGLKGSRVGGAAVSQKHAGFIVNLEKATAADVKNLINMIQNTVEKERGFRPQVELRFIPNET